MSIRIFTLKFNNLIGGFDDKEVRAFIADKEVEAIHDHAFVHQNLPYITLVVTYRGQSDNENSAPTDTNKSYTPHPKEDWRKLISESDLPLFNSFREWRTAKSKEEGVPVYFVCTNKHLTDIIQQRPGNVSELMRVEGFGDKRVKKYGSDILEILTKKSSNANDSSSSTQASE